MTSKALDWKMWPKNETALDGNTDRFYVQLECIGYSMSKGLVKLNVWDFSSFHERNWNLAKESFNSWRLSSYFFKKKLEEILFHHARYFS